MLLISNITELLQLFWQKRNRLIPVFETRFVPLPLFLFASVIVLLSSCKSDAIVIKSEVEDFLQVAPNQKLESIETEISFWSGKLEVVKDDIASQVKLGSLYSKRFQYTGKISDVHKSDSFYRVAHSLQKLFGSGTYRSLAANCVTQHKFREASLYLDSAFEKGDDKYITLLQQFDVAAELGDYLRASTIMQQFKYKNTFEYYIRQSKLMDHKGEADASLAAMEKAMAKALDSKNEELILWAKSNLADMYGHQNRIQESYALYKEVLKKDKHYYHALKGIAWIAYSHDKNTALAKQILQHLQTLHPVPDYDFMLAEIAAFESNTAQKELHTQRFLKAVSHPAYGDMYNKYVFSIMSDELNNYSAALQIATTEVNNRPTPQSYDLLAWAYYKNNRFQEAATVADTYIAAQNHEPDALFHLGVIYLRAGKKELAKKYLTEAGESSYELGPLAANEINEYLKQL
ncbi:MAG TPA: tetratricopeptide repeat protein [Lacibacter sp.]|nr:tetratricopeptide repeat protein [Lacibacter sp.]